MKIKQTALLPKNREFIVWILMALILGGLLSEIIRLRWVFGPELYVPTGMTLFIETVLLIIWVGGRRIGKRGRWYLLINEKGMSKVRPGLFRNEITMVKIDFSKCLKMELVEDSFLGECLRMELAFSRKTTLIPVGQYEKSPKEILEFCLQSMSDSAKNT